MLLIKGEKIEIKTENNKQPDSDNVKRGHDLGTMDVPKTGNWLTKLGVRRESEKCFLS